MARLLMISLGLLILGATPVVVSADTQVPVDHASDPVANRHDRPDPLEGLSYQPGRGLSIPGLGLNIGGFGTVEMDREEGSAFSLQLDSMSFLVLYRPIDAFRVFAELEIGDVFQYQARGPTRSDPKFEIERLYAEVSLDDPVNLRFGKFQTPVGRRNLVLAEPFVFTALDPVQLDTAFDEQQTGVAVTGSLFSDDGAIDYWLYGQIMDPLHPGETPTPVNRSIGARIQLTRVGESASIGASFLASEKRGEWSTLGGVDFEANLQNLFFNGELVYQSGGLPGRDLIGVFTQGRFEFLPGVSLVARYEYFNRLGSKGTAAHIGDFGLAWQPRPWLILKATYREASRETPDVTSGFASSVSVVF